MTILQTISGKLVFIQLAALIIGKILFGIVQMPYSKSQLDVPHPPFLIIMIIFYTINIVIKFLRNKKQLLKRLLYLQLSSFLLWVITFLGVVFQWGLCDQMEWSIFDKITSSLGQILQTFIFTLVMHPKLITKIQFFGYQALLATSIIGLGVKTVQFIAYNSQAKYKDIVLLNLTTQIALSIVLMDMIERSFSKSKNLKNQDSQSNQNNNAVPADGNTSRLEAEMVMRQN